MAAKKESFLFTRNFRLAYFFFFALLVLLLLYAGYQFARVVLIQEIRFELTREIMVLGNNERKLAEWFWRFTYRDEERARARNEILNHIAKFGTIKEEILRLENQVREVFPETLGPSYHRSLAELEDLLNLLSKLMEDTNLNQSFKPDDLSIVEAAVSDVSGAFERFAMDFQTTWQLAFQREKNRFLLNLALAFLVALFISYFIFLPMQRTIGEQLSALRIESEQHRIKSAGLDQAGEMIAITDQGGNILSVNPAFEKMTGYASGEVIGHNMSILNSGRHSEEFFKNLWGTLKAGNVWKDILVNRRKDGSEYFEESSIAPIRDDQGQVSNYIALKTDVTDRVNRNRELEEEKKRAEQANRIKDRFLSLLAHDLRSPFTSIMGLLELLQSDPANPLTPRQNDYLGKVIDLSKNSLELIENILNVNRFQSGKVELQRRFFDPHSLVGSVLTSQSFLAEKKGIRLENQVDPNQRLYADPLLYSEVLKNLLHNAIKFCRKGDSIQFFSPPPETPGVGVRDSGIGMNRQVLAGVILGATPVSLRGTAGEKGTGLGLSLSHEILRAHGGLLKAESDEGKGTTVLALLPIIEPRVLLYTAGGRSGAGVADLLAPKGIDVALATKPAEAFEILERSPFQAVILDAPAGASADFMKAMAVKPGPRSFPYLKIQEEQEHEFHEFLASAIRVETMPRSELPHRLPAWVRQKVGAG